MRHIARYVESAIHIFAFCLLSGAFVPLWRPPIVYAGVPPEEDLLQQALFLFTFLSGIAVSVRTPLGLLVILRRPNILVAILCIYAILSSIWSAAPEATLRRSLALLLTITYGSALAYKYNYRQILYFLSAAYTLMLLSSVLIALFAPTVGIMGLPHPGAWRGVFGDKIWLGRASALGILVYASLILEERRIRRAASLALLCMSAVALIKSNAVAAQVALSLALGVLLTVWLWPFIRRIRIALLLEIPIIGLVSIILITLNLGAILERLDRDTTLTGRIPLWGVLLHYIQDQALLGYGYGAFWQSGDVRSGAVWYRAGWDAWQSHNFYIEIALSLGIPGLLLWIIVLTTVIWASIFVSVYLRIHHSAFCLPVIIFLSIYSATDSSILYWNSIGTLFFFLPLLFFQYKIRRISPRSDTAIKVGVPLDRIAPDG